VPAIDCFFSGTGDMFAALILVRLREAVFTTEGLSDIGAWVSGDDVESKELPLAKAAEKVLASMHVILDITKAKRDEEWAQYRKHAEKGDDEKRDRQARSKAAEVRLVRNVGLLRNAEVQFFAEKL
jgi:pyridoxine kinase